MPIFGTAQQSPENHLRGLLSTWVSTTEVQLLSGVARDSTNVTNIPLAAPVTVDITANGANGLDTGAAAIDTWYALHVIMGANGVAGLLSLSDTAPILPTGYDSVFRRVDWIRVDGAGNITQYIKKGEGDERVTTYSSTISDRTVLNSGSATVRTSVDLSDWIPPTSTQAELSVWFDNSGGAATDKLHIETTGAGIADPRVTYTNGVLTTTTEAKGPCWIDSDASQSIDYSVSNALNDAFLYVTSWKETP